VVLLAEASLPPSTTCAAVYALLVPPKHTKSSPSCTRQDNKIFPRGVAFSLSDTPLLAGAPLRGARLSGNSVNFENIGSIMPHDSHSLLKKTQARKNELIP
jgi:hypothetical protein